MLLNTTDLEKYTITATDGDIGQVKDLYFDDHAWVVRYLVVETGSWLSNRKVLISPVSIENADWLERTVPVSITKEQVRNSPNIDTDIPVSRQNEAQYMGYYGYSGYWGGAGMWGGGMYPYAMVPGYAGYGVDRVEREREMEDYLRSERARHRNDDPQLRSCNAVVRYHLHATDGEIGHVCGFLLDGQTWAIRYLIVDTSNWWMGHKVLVAPEWISGVHWSDNTVSVDLSRESVKAAPVYDPHTAAWSLELDRDLYRHYGRKSYWSAITPSGSQI
jgi:hypothetical protein